MFLFYFSLSCVPCVANFSKLSFFWLPIRYQIRLFGCGIAPIKTETRPHETLNTDNSILIILMKFNIRNVICWHVLSILIFVIFFKGIVSLNYFNTYVRRGYILISLYKWKYHVLYLQFLRCYCVEIKIHVKIVTIDTVSVYILLEKCDNTKRWSGNQKPYIKGQNIQWSTKNRYRDKRWSTTHYTEN